MAKKSQDKVLESLLNKLGYESVDQIPSMESLTPKVIDGTMTVREAAVVDLYARGLRIAPGTLKTDIGKAFAEKFNESKRVMPEKAGIPTPEAAFTRINTVINSTVKSGFSLDTPFKNITNNRTAMEKIAENTKSIDPHWSGVFQSADQTVVRYSDLGASAYQNPKAKATGLAGATQSRKSKAFEEIVPAKKAFPEIIAGLNGVDDVSTKNALVTSFLAPFRPGEIANLRLGEYDLDTVTTARTPGYFDVEKGAIIFPVKTEGKKSAQTLFLDKNGILYNVLKSQAEVAETMGSGLLFPDVTTGKMTGAIQENITPRFQQFEDVLGRPFDEAKDFRKLVASMMLGELGYGEEADRMMGHTNDAQINKTLTAVGSKHYFSRIARSDNPLGAVQTSLEHMIGEVMDAPTLNETAATLGLNIEGYTDSSAKPVTVIPRGGEIGGEAVVQDRPMSQEELASMEARREKATAEARLGAEQAEAQRLEAQQANLEKRVEVEKKKLEVNQQLEEMGIIPEEKAAGKTKSVSVEDAPIIDTPESKAGASKMMNFLRKLKGGVKAVAPPLVGGTLGAADVFMTGEQASTAMAAEGDEQKRQMGELGLSVTPAAPMQIVQEVNPLTQMVRDLADESEFIQERGYSSEEETASGFADIED